MKIVTQSGETVYAHEIQTSGKEIRCTPQNDKRKRVVAGVYDSMKRATEVFAEMTCEGWNNKNPSYVMPKE